MEQKKLQTEQENSGKLPKQSEVDNKGTSPDQPEGNVDNKGREDKSDKSNCIKIDRFSNKNQNLKTVEHCTRWWIFSFTISLILLFVIVLGFILYYDFISASKEIKVEHYNGNYEWGIYLVLVIIGGLVGYALYLVKGVHDAEEYERKKDLEIDRKLYHEKVISEINQVNLKNQEEKDRIDRQLAEMRNSIVSELSEKRMSLRLQHALLEILRLGNNSDNLKQQEYEKMYEEIQQIVKDKDIYILSDTDADNKMKEK